jgi:hypothetical protein
VYDGGTTATGICAVSASLVNITDDASCSVGSASFADKHVANGKTVSATGLALGGAQAGNYTLSPTTATDTADITPKAITVTGAAATKVYDGTIISTVLPTVSPALMGGDTAVLAQTYDNKNVAGSPTKVMTPTIAITDGHPVLAGNNYAVTIATSANGTITKAPVTASFTADNKVYDQTTAATILTRSVSPIIAPDTNLTVFLTGGTATFNNKHVGTVKTVTGVFTDADLAGADAGNYTISATNTTTADITQKALVVTATGTNKNYDGTTAATVTYADDRIAGDDFTVSGTAAFTDKDAAMGKTINISAITLSGTDAGNYLPNSTTTTTATIDPLPITVTAVTNSKEYDGDTSSVAVPTVVPGLVGAETAAITQTYDNKNVGVAKVLTPVVAFTGTALAGNYAVTPVTDATGVITTKALAVTFTANNKAYDATTAATIATGPTLGGVVTGETVTIAAGLPTFDTKDFGTAKTVTLPSITIGGADAGNYTVPTSATTTADITKLGLTVTYTVNNKQFDGTNTATITTRALSGVIVPEVVTVSAGTATFADAIVGAGKVVTALANTFTLAGADAANYTVATAPNTTGEITAAPAPVSGGGGGGGGGGGTGYFYSAPISFTGNNNLSTSNSQISGIPTSPGSVIVTNQPGLGGAVAGVGTFKFNTNFRPGSRLVPDIIELQKVLIAKGLLNIAKPTGIYGPATVAAVKKYQQANGIPVTGNVFALTRAALNAGK